MTESEALSIYRKAEARRQINRARAFKLFKEYLTDLLDDTSDMMDGNLQYGFVETPHGVCGELSFNDQRGYIRVVTIYDCTEFQVTPTGGTTEHFNLELEEESDFQDAIADYVERA